MLSLEENRVMETTDLRSTLLSAAELLEERSGAATAGPWGSTPDVLIGGHAVAQMPLENPEGPYLADFVLKENADYAGLVNPLVGTALAVLLRTEAAVAAGDEDHSSCMPETCPTIAAYTTALALLNQPGKEE